MSDNYPRVMRDRHMLAERDAEIRRLEELLLEWADHGSSDDLLREVFAIRKRKEAAK